MVLQGEGGSEQENYQRRSTQGQTNSAGHGKGVVHPLDARTEGSMVDESTASTSSSTLEQQYGQQSNQQQQELPQSLLSQQLYAQQTPQQRKRIAQSACELCRKKRTRCVVEGDDSRCNNCIALGRECVFSGVDKRKESVRELRSRLAYLEDLFHRLRYARDEGHFRQLWQEIRTNDPEVYNSVLQGESLPRLQTADPSSSSSSAAGRQPTFASFRGSGRQTQVGGGASLATRRRRSSTPDKDVENSASSDGRPSPPPPPSLSASLPTGDSRPPGVSSSNKEDPLTKRFRRHSASSVDSPADLSRLVERLTISPNGTIRAHASRQNALFQDGIDAEDLPSDLDITSRTVLAAKVSSQISRSRPSMIPETQNIDQQLLFNIVPPGTTIARIQHLLHQYFVWHYPCFPVLCRPVFIDHLCRGGRYASPLLLNAVLAVSSYYSDDLTLRTIREDPRTTGIMFMDKAKQFLDEDLERPSILTVQALSMMATRELMSGNDGRSWMYNGMAIRIAVDLGLHIDARILKTKGVLTDEDLHIRSRTFWTVYLCDKEFCAIMRRPSALTGYRISCPRPHEHKGEDFDWFMSLHQGQITPLQESSRPTDGALFVNDLLYDLADTFTVATDSVLFSKRTTANELLKKLSISTEKIRAIISRLPPLQRDPDRLRLMGGKGNGILPALITVHMMGYFSLLRLNCPLATVVGSSSPAQAVFNPEGNPADLAPREVLYTSAIQMVKLADLYLEASIYGWRTAVNDTQHCLRSAALALLFEIEELTTTTKAGSLAGRMNSTQQMERLKTAKMYYDRCEQHIRAVAPWRPSALATLRGLQRMIDMREGRRGNQLEILLSPSPDIQKIGHSAGYGNAYEESGRLRQPQPPPFISTAAAPSNVASEVSSSAYADSGAPLSAGFLSEPYVYPFGSPRAEAGGGQLGAPVPYDPFDFARNTPNRPSAPAYLPFDTSASAVLNADSAPKSEQRPRISSPNQAGSGSSISSGAVGGGVAANTAASNYLYPLFGISGDQAQFSMPSYSPQAAKRAGGVPSNSSNNVEIPGALDMSASYRHTHTQSLPRSHLERGHAASAQQQVPPSTAHLDPSIAGSASVGGPVHPGGLNVNEHGEASLQDPSQFGYDYIPSFYYPQQQPGSSMGGAQEPYHHY